MKVEIIHAIANVIDADTTLRVDAGGEGVFESIDSIDVASATLIVFCADGHPYEVTVRRMVERTVIEGVLPDPITPKTDEPRTIITAREA